MENAKEDAILMRVENDTEYVFGSAIKKESITSILFHDRMEKRPIDAWDVSASQNGSVMAWEENGVLHICADGTIKANP